MEAILTGRGGNYTKSLTFAEYEALTEEEKNNGIMYIITDDQGEGGNLSPEIIAKLDNHVANKNNPHEVTKAQVGLGNVDNTSDTDKPISTAQAEEFINKQNQINDFLIPKTIGPTALASFSDGVDGAILGKCVVNIEPVQSGSGDPSPTNVRPISGWTGAKVSVTGKNLLNTYGINNPNFSGVSVVSQNDGTLQVNGTKYGGNYYGIKTLNLSPGEYTLSIQNKNPLSSSPSVCSFFTPDMSDYSKYVYGLATYGEDSNIYSQKIVVENGKENITVGISFIYDNSVYNGERYALWLTPGDSQLDYEPYKDNIYDISFPSEAGTVYGGTLDVGTGVLTVTKKRVDIASLYWFIYNNRFAANLYTIVPSSSENVPPKFICSYFRPFPSGNSGSYSTEDNIIYQDASTSDPGLFVKCDSASTVDDFLNSVSGQTIVYELATPQIYQLTPVQIRTLLGLNNIYADCGDVTVQYRGDVPNLYENIAVITKQKNKFYCPPLYLYDGEDLTVKFADEIAQYSDVGDWLQARLAAKDISGTFVKDFFKFTTSNGYTFKARIGDINHDLGYGDTEVTKYHIDFICDEPWPENRAWNKVNYNNGIAAETSPWCACDLYYFLNSLSGNVPNDTGADPATIAVDYTSTGVFDKFPAWLRNAIVERRSLEPTRYSAGALLTDDDLWAWKNIGKLWVPSEIEYYGFVAWGTHNGYSIGDGHMYPLMQDSKMRIKRSPDGSRCRLWLRRAYSGSSTYATNCHYIGSADGNECTYPWVAPPVCFRIMAN